MKSKKTLLQLRQGDVQIQQIHSLPEGCKEVPLDRDGAIVLAYGETTGHRHAVYDHMVQRKEAPGSADEITEAAIARAQAKARLLIAPNGERYLEVKETVHLTHEEHTAHAIPPGIYQLPIQTEYSPQALRRVVD